MTGAVYVNAPYPAPKWMGADAFYEDFCGAAPVAGSTSHVAHSPPLARST